MKRALLILGAVLITAACTEKPQTIRTSAARSDEAPYAGTKYPHAVPGWTAGDERSWKEQLRVRTQRGQNDYSRM